MLYRSTLLNCLTDNTDNNINLPFLVISCTATGNDKIHLYWKTGTTVGKYSSTWNAKTIVLMLLFMSQLIWNIIIINKMKKIKHTNNSNQSKQFQKPSNWDKPNTHNTHAFTAHLLGLVFHSNKKWRR